MVKKKHQQYVGSWTETPCEPIHLPFTAESLLLLLSAAQDEASEYTHQQIIDWASLLWRERDEGALADIDDPALDTAAELASDMDAQWELFLANTFTLEELRELNFAAVELPQEWFAVWEKELTKATASPIT